MAAKKTAPTPPTCLEHREDVMRRAALGEVTPAELLETFDLLKAHQAEIEAYYDAFTIAELKMVYYGHPGMKKGQIIKSLASALRRSLLMKQSYSVPIFGDMDAAIREGIVDTTAADIAAYAERQRVEDAELEARKAHRKKSLSAPETLAEYRTFLKVKPRSKLSIEQRMNYDELAASETKQARAVARAKREAERATIEQVEISGDLVITVTEEMHTEKQEPRWIARCSRRVEREEFQRLHDAAKLMGGRWSRFSQGFSFFESSKAQKFASVHQAGQSVAEERAAWKEQKRLTALERLRAVAEGTIDDAEEKLYADRKTNTVRRANIANGIEADARRTKALGETALAMADAIEMQEVFFLNGVRARTHIELLESLMRRAKYERLNEESRQPSVGYRHYEEGKDRPLCEADLEWVKYPWPSLDPDDARVILDAMKGARGTKYPVSLIESLVRGRSSGWVDLTNSEQRDAYETLIDLARKKTGSDYRVRNAIDNYEGEGSDYRRLRAMDIHTGYELRAGLREYLRIRREREQEDPVKRAQRELIGRKFPGYFPSPRPAVARLLALIHLEPGMRTLEPQAGQGHIADALRDAGAVVSCVELQFDMREILRLKGHNVIGQDCFELTTRFPRVVMNPPFENGLDGEMVRHAFEHNLEPGGRLVAIMGEGTFSRSDAKATSFREWLESAGGTSEKLPDGTFLESDVATGTSTRVVVIDAPGGEDDEDDHGDAAPDCENIPAVEVPAVSDDFGQIAALVVQNTLENISTPLAHVIAVPAEIPPMLEMSERTIAGGTIQIHGRIAGHPFIYRAMAGRWMLEIADDFDATLGRHGQRARTVGSDYDQVSGWTYGVVQHDIQDQSDEATSALLHQVALWYTDGCAEPGWGWERFDRRTPPTHTHDGKPWPSLAEGIPWPEDEVRPRYLKDFSSVDVQIQELIRKKRIEAVEPKDSTSGCLELERCTACQSPYVVIFADESRACAKCGWAKTFEQIAAECIHDVGGGQYQILAPHQRYFGQPVVYTGGNLDLGKLLLQKWMMKRPEFSFEQLELVAVAHDARVIRQEKMHVGSFCAIQTNWREGRATEDLGRFLCVHPIQGVIPVDGRSWDLGWKHEDLADLLEPLPIDQAKQVIDAAVKVGDPDLLWKALKTLLERSQGQGMSPLLNAINDAWNGMPKCDCQKKGLKSALWAGALYHQPFEEARAAIWRIMSWPEPLRSARTWGEIEHSDRKDVLGEIDRRQASLTELWSLTDFLRDVTRYSLPIYDESGALRIPGSAVADEHLLRLESQATERIAQATLEQLRLASDVYFEYMRRDPNNTYSPATVRQQLHQKYITAIRLRLRELDGWEATVTHPVGYLTVKVKPGTPLEESAAPVEEPDPTPAEPPQPPSKKTPDGQLSLF